MPADGTPSPTFSLADAAEILGSSQGQPSAGRRALGPAAALKAAFAEIEAIAAAQPVRRDPIFRDDSDWPERVSLRRSVGLERDGF